MSKTFIISLGGSILVPDSIDVVYVRAFVKFIKKYTAKNCRFFIIVGGGRTARAYQQAAAAAGVVQDEDKDWLGIHATRLNAHLLRTVLRSIAHPRILAEPKVREKITRPVCIGAGWRPGRSTDFMAVSLAKLYGVTTIINLSNIDYAYTADPKKYAQATPLKAMTWKELQKLTGQKWTPGMHTPFDPIATKKAQKMHLKLILVNGKKLKNLGCIFEGKSFMGTVVE